MKTRSMRMRGLLGGVVLLLPTLGYSQEEKSPAHGYEMNVRLLETDSVMEVATGFDVEAFAAEAKVAIDLIEKEIGIFESKDQSIAVRFTLFPNKDYKVQVFGRPELDAAARKKFMSAIGGVKLSRSKLVKMRYQIECNRGTPPAVPEGTMWPAGSQPGYVLRAQAFEKADIKGKIALLQRWAREEILPVLGAYQRRADPKFEGVVGLGKLLEKTDYSKPMDVAKLIDANNDYWRGMLEMNQGNALVTATRIFMEVANGNLEQAKQFAGLHMPFLDEKASPTEFITEFARLHDELRKQLNPKIMAAIKYFDGGDFAGAITKCESILKQHPRDAWTRYELWFSKKMLAMASEPDGEFQDWHEAAKEIYAMNSMYPIAVTATNDDEAFALLARLELKEMKPAKNRDEHRKNRIKQADLALDLEVYPFAAEAYWLILGGFPKGSYDERPMMDFAIYAIDRAGGGGIIEMLGREREKVAKAPEEQVKQHRRDNALSGKFKDKAGGDK